MIIIGREIAISALREWLAEHATIVHVSMLGKMKTAAQMTSIVALLLHMELGGIDMHSVGLFLLWVAAILTLWSGYEYIRDALPELMGRDKPTADEEQPQQSPDQ